MLLDGGTSLKSLKKKKNSTSKYNYLKDPRNINAVTCLFYRHERKVEYFVLNNTT